MNLDEEGVGTDMAVNGRKKYIFKGWISDVHTEAILCNVSCLLGDTEYWILTVYKKDFFTE